MKSVSHAESTRESYNFKSILFKNEQKQQTVLMIFLVQIFTTCLSMENNHATATLVASNLRIKFNTSSAILLVKTVRHE